MPPKLLAAGSLSYRFFDGMIHDSFGAVQHARSCTVKVNPALHTLVT